MLDLGIKVGGFSPRELEDPGKGKMRERLRQLLDSSLAGVRVLVLGLGTSGVAVAEFLASRGVRLSVSDRRPAVELAADLRRLQEQGLLEEVETGGHTEALCRRQDLIVVSPGVPLDIPPLQAARQAGIPVIGEVELAANYITAPLIGITGTNGKTTCVTLLGEVCRQAGRRTFVGGNIGTPIIRMAAGRDWDLGVIELSSFQLESTVFFHPRLAVLLNVASDHQDRYDNFGDYLAAKMAIARAQDRRDCLLFNLDDPLLAAQYQAWEERWAAGEEVPRPVPFSCRSPLETGGCLHHGQLHCRVVDLAGRPRECRVELPELRLAGAHNRSNMLAVFLAGFIFGLEPAVMLSAMAAFRGLPHRLEYVGRVKGVDYVNDSKATNLAAVLSAIGSFSNPIVLLLGGRDKGADFSRLAEHLGGRVREIVPFGEAAAAIARQLPHFYAGVMAPDLRGAVALAAELARPGDVVLLAPGCASFDEFAGYHERGAAFKNLVRGLAATGAR